MSSSEKQRKLDTEARKLRKQVKAMEKARRKANKIKFVGGPSYKHNFLEQKRIFRENRLLAAVQAQEESRKESRWIQFEDFAFSRFMTQRESYVRYEEWTSELLGMDRAKLFDITLHLSTPAGISFQEPSIGLPLRPIYRRRHWNARVKPYRPVFVTDGSLAVGEIPIHRSERFLAVTAKLFARRFSMDSRFVNGPTQVFLTMRTESGEDTIGNNDVAAPQKAIQGKKRLKNRLANKQSPQPAAKPAKKPVDIFAGHYHDPDEWSIASESDTGSNWGDEPFSSELQLDDEDIQIQSKKSSNNKKNNKTQPQKKKKNKQKGPTFAEYVDFEDPTLPTPEDIAQAKHEEWHERYIRGDTLYWQQQDSLTQTLTTSLYFSDGDFASSFASSSPPPPPSPSPPSRLLPQSASSTEASSDPFSTTTLTPGGPSSSALHSHHNLPLPEFSGYAASNIYFTAEDLSRSASSDSSWFTVVDAAASSPHSGDSLNSSDSNSTYYSASSSLYFSDDFDISPSTAYQHDINGPEIMTTTSIYFDTVVPRSNCDSNSAPLNTFSSSGGGGGSIYFDDNTFTAPPPPPSPSVQPQKDSQTFHGALETSTPLESHSAFLSTSTSTTSFFFDDKNCYSSPMIQDISAFGNPSVGLSYFE